MRILVSVAFLIVSTAAGFASAAPNGVPVRIMTIGNWRTHDPAGPMGSAEPWQPADVAGFLEIYPQAYLDLGIRDGFPVGNRYWRDKGRDVDQLQALLLQAGTDARGRICVSERPDVLSKFVRESCALDQGGQGCDWEGGMDGGFGEQERIVKHAGIATGSTANGLEDRRAGWQAAVWRHRLLVLRPGRPDEEGRRVVSSSATTLTVEPAWTQPPNAGDRYEIRGSFDPRWVKLVPRAMHEATVRDLWTNKRNVCGTPAAPRACLPPAEPLDPFDPVNRRSWPIWFDRAALMGLASPSAVPALYGAVGDAAPPSTGAPRSWTDPYFGVSAVVMNVADPAYRDWRIRHLMYKLQDHGIGPGEPACINLSYKPGWYTHYDEGTRGPSGDACAVPGSGLWTGPAHVCRDGRAPGGPLVAGLYGPGEYERAINSYIRETIAQLGEKGWSQLRIIITERPSFTPALWTILDQDVRQHPAVIGELLSSIEPSLAELRNRPRRPPANPQPPTNQASQPGTPVPSETPTPPPATPSTPHGGPSAEPPTAPGGSSNPAARTAAEPSRGSISRSSGGGGGGGVVEPPSADR